MTSYNTA